MIYFEEEYFQSFKYTKNQIEKYFSNAMKDLQAAQNLKNTDIAFRICYDAVIKLGIALIAKQNYKVRSHAGHHTKILDKMGEILKVQDEINYLQYVRRKRNIDLYEGGMDFTETEAENLLRETERIFAKAKSVFF